MSKMERRIFTGYPSQRERLAQVLEIDAVSYWRRCRRMKSWRCPACRDWVCVGRWLRGPPDTRCNASREGIERYQGRQPCATTAALPLYHMNPHLVLLATPLSVR